MSGQHLNSNRPNKDTKMIEKQKYILITPAKNEASHIKATIESVTSQTILPQKWVIVDDGSTDNTSQIVEQYLPQFDFIELIHLQSSDRDFSSKVKAFNRGYEAIKHSEFDFIGNLDADITFSSRFYEQLISEFLKNPKLGIAGGFIMEEYNGKLKNRPGNSIDSVAGGVQMFRRKCFLEVNGYLLLKYGYEDMVSQTFAKMHGWHVKSFPHIPAIHHGKQSYLTLNSFLRFYREGVSEYLVGYHPLFEIFKFLNRLLKKPIFIGSILRLWGYFVSALNPGTKHVTSDEFIKFLRAEQKGRMRKSISAILGSQN